VLYRLRDILLLMVVGSFIALLLNPLVDGLERWKIKRRGYAVAIVALGTVISLRPSRSPSAIRSSIA